jgi:hypothetical protein
VACEGLAMAVPAAVGSTRVLDLAMAGRRSWPTSLRGAVAQRRSGAMAAWMPSRSTVSPAVNAVMASPSR